MRSTKTTFAAFTDSTGIAVEVLASGDAGAMVNQAILTKDNPLADVLFGIDDTFLQRGLNEGIFESFVSERLAEIRPELLPATDAVTPIDYGDVCLNYDKEVFESAPVTLRGFARTGQPTRGRGSLAVFARSCLPIGDN